MPYKSVRKKSKEIVKLLLNAKKNKESEVNQFPTCSNQICFIPSENENFDASEGTFSSSEEEVESGIINDLNIKEEIAAWTVKYTITNRAVNDLLNILVKRFPLLPKDKIILI